MLISGTFDVANYGDLLFPIVAAARLEPFGYRVVPVAPTSATTVFRDALPARSLADVMDDDAPIAGVLIGGGEIVHAWSARFLREYQDSSTAASAYAALWFGASALAARRDSPVVWNAPGAPSVLPRMLRDTLLAPALKAADHVAVRDRASAGSLSGCIAQPAIIVPDTALDVARIWPREALSEAYRQFILRMSLCGTEATLCVHLRPGGLGHASIPEVAASIDRIARDLDLTPVLLSIGPSLGDADTLQALSDRLTTRHVLANRPTTLREIASVIAHARGYLGNSLHGYVTAAAYGVPGVVVARPGFRKFLGFAEQIGRPEDVVGGWSLGFVRLANGLMNRPQPVLGADIVARLDQHWDRIVASLADPNAGRARRAAFLRHVGGMTEFPAMLPAWIARPRQQWEARHAVGS
ncbi:MAG: polysaccharide pyruvyl transferase family protein [Acetobacteraceae bacterium]